MASPETRNCSIGIGASVISEFAMAQAQAIMPVVRRLCTPHDGGLGVVRPACSVLTDDGIGREREETRIAADGIAYTRAEWRNTTVVSRSGTRRSRPTDQHQHQHRHRHRHQHRHQHCRMVEDERRVQGRPLPGSRRTDTWTCSDRGRF